MASILMAVPSYGGAIQHPCVKGLIETTIALREAGHQCHYAGVSISDVVEARNFLASRASIWMPPN